jgi:putative ABC transport system substrate-binding protein
MSAGIETLSRKVTILAQAALLALSAVLGFTPGPARAADQRIAVLISGAGAPYDDTLEGLKQYLEKRGLKAGYAVLQLEGDGRKISASVQELKAARPSLIVTLGALATEGVLREVADTPVVAAMILKADLLRKAPNATGVVLEFPLETQLNWIRRVLPKARTIGVVFSPAENRQRVGDARQAAEKMGMKLDAQEVREPRDIPGALERLAKTADVLWGMADSMALTPQTAKLFLLFSFRNKIPFVGPSSAWVKAGALYSLDWDYADMGAQCGEAAVKILQGARAGSIAPAPPRKISFSLNRRTAEEMSLSLSDELIREARMVF